MGRHRQFDETKVLESAMRCFWDRGYEQASVRDLAAEMSITGASLYNAFGDKRSLYRRALTHYVQQSVHDRVRRLEDGLPPLSALRAFFDEIIDRSLGDPRHRGCMLVNAALEVGPGDEELRSVLAAELGFIAAFFVRRIRAGREDGSVTSSRPPEALAQMLLSVLLGIRVLARTAPNRAALEAAATISLSVLLA